MKKHKIFFVFAVILSAISTSCKKSMGDLYSNPNKPTTVPASLVLNGVLNDMYDAPYGDYEKWSQYYLINYDYYGNNRYDFGSASMYYNTLKNVTKMEEEAVNAGSAVVNPYSALGKFFRAYFFTKMSLQLGDIPMNEGLKGSENLTPAYDSQKDVFLQSFKWLDSANNDIASLITKGETPFAGDIYYNGSLSHWQKVVNTFRLRLLIHLSKKADDGDLKVKEQFQEIVSNPTKYPLMESMADNLAYVYVYPTNLYPNNPGNFGFDALRYNTSATYIEILTALHDPRVFVTAEPAQAIVDAGGSPTAFSSFVGANPGEDLGQMYIKTNNGQYSLLNRKRYYDTFTGENSIQIGYPEMCFNIAEAINRGWITGGPLGDAEAYYKAGIKASMEFYGIPQSGPMTVYFLKKGASLGTYNSYTINVDMTAYYNNEAVKYAGNNSTGLTEILQQKYLALFRHSGLESYYTFRRTGVPLFTTGPGTGNSQRIAMRFQYPEIEKSANQQNYEASLQQQYSGNDDINAQMWLIK